jgi:hypothetical protein
VLIEGNDPRLIDVALVSKLPLGQATSWQHARHKSEPTSLPIFSRDLLEVDVLAPGRTKRLFTVYVNHLKSKYTEAKSGPAHELELKEAAERRGMQAETLVEIVERKQRPKGRYVVLGDMNDTPTSKPLESFKGLVNGLKQVEERGGTPNYGDTPPGNSAGRTASKSPASRRSTTFSTKCGSARSSRNGRWVRSSSDVPS